MAIKPIKAGHKSRLFISGTEKYVSMLSGKGINVIIGHAPATDGKKNIFLPELPEGATESQIIQWLSYAQHEQAHFHGDSHPWEMPTQKFHHFCINAVDDVRVELGQEKEYPGIRENRKLSYQLDLDTFLTKELKNAVASNLQAFLPSLLKYLIVYNRINQMGAPIALEVSQDILDFYDKYLKIFEVRVNSQVKFADAKSLGTDIYNVLYELIKDQTKPSQGDGDESDEESDDGSEGDESDEESEGDESGGDESGDQSEGDESDEESEGDESGDQSEGDESGDQSEGDESGDQSEGDESEGDESSDQSKDPQKSLEDDAKKILDELNAQDHKTVSDHLKDAVDEISSQSSGEYRVENGVVDDIDYNTEHAFGRLYVEKGKELLGSSGPKMTRLFISQTRESVDFNQKSGRFDMRSFVSDSMDKRTDVYTNVRQGSLDKAAISFAIDNSGSMHGPRIEKAYALMGGLLHYLDKAGIPSEACGFTAGDCESPHARTEPVILRVIKTFDESFKGKAALRCHPPTELGVTIELDALKFLAPRLYQRPEGKKILFVLSDGEPNAGNPILTNKLVEAYKKYILKLRELGIFVIGFGIDCSVSKYFGDDCVNTSTSNFSSEVVKKLTEILNRR